jgi:predicted porin
MDNKNYWIGAAVIAALVAGAAYSKAKAADLGGNCCSDLEERVAELEASTAKKGNRKMSLTISGQVNKALLWHDVAGLPGADSFRVIDNANSGSRFAFMGDAKLGKDYMAGFIIELGVDETKGKGLYDLFPADDVSVRHSAVWMSSPFGKVTLGQTSTATDGIVEINTANTNVASLPLSAEPLWTYLGAPALTAPGVNISLNPTPFDGGRLQIVRYDTPVLAGVTVSASWAGGQSALSGDVMDAAVRYAGEFSGIRIAAGAGYRVEQHELAAAADTKTMAGSASVMHMGTGLFVTGSVGHQEANVLFGDLQMWQVVAGWEKNVFGIGATTLYAEYADHQLKSLAVDSTFMGGGVVQKIDAAAMDVYLSWRSYDLGGVLDANVVMGGARIQF